MTPYLSYLTSTLPLVWKSKIFIFYPRITLIISFHVLLSFSFRNVLFFTTARLFVCQSISLSLLTYKTFQSKHVSSVFLSIYTVFVHYIQFCKFSLLVLNIVSLVLLIPNFVKIRLFNLDRSIWTICTLKISLSLSYCDF